MKLYVAKTAGFCFGVKRACDGVYEALGKKNIFLLGELIHNNTVMNDIISKGGKVVENVSEIPKNGTCVIRAHGVTRKTEDEIRNNNIDCMNMTCPYVEKIHKIVSEESKKGRKVIIFGKKSHPEVTGIAGHCENPLIATDFEEITDYIFPDDKISVVAQTTVEKEGFASFCEDLKKKCGDIEIFDTICTATKRRQTEASEIAKAVDFMIVIGSQKSSNSRELYKKCKIVRENTVLAENLQDLFRYFNIDENDGQRITKLKNILYTKFKGVGVTAGASTPQSSVEEVITVMSEERTNTSEFEKELENYLVSPVHTGKTVTGVVEQITETEVRINIEGYKGVGIISLDELTDDTTAKPSDIVKIGDEITAKVIKPNDLEGYCLLSKKAVDLLLNMSKIKEAYENGEILTGKVVRALEKGVIVSSNSVQIFVPAPLASLRFVQDLSTLVNTEVRFKVIEFDERRNRAKGSVKAVLAEEQKALEDAFWNSVEEGKAYTGKVKSLTSFGAFVDLGGVDGLIHITELSWTRIKHPSDVVKEGDVVDVYVKSVDKEKKKISLGYKKTEDNPWTIFTNNYKLNDVVECKIVRIVPFGAFAQIIPGVDGLIHISQIADKHVAKTEDELTVGETVQAKIIEIKDEENSKRVSLSIRELIAPKAEETTEAKETAEEEGLQSNEATATEEVTQEAVVTEEATEAVVEATEEASAEE